MDKHRLHERLQIYVVTDERDDGNELISIVQKAILGGATAIQLRRKRELGRRFVELGRAIRHVTSETDVLFFVNDRVDVAAIVDADGVHIGQDDLACSDARRILGPNKIIGVSAESVAEAVAAEREGADYLGVGAIYPTASKPDPGRAGLAELAEIRKAVSLPIVAIGGIRVDNARDPILHGASGVAVVSAVMSADNPQEAASSLRSVVQAALNERTV